MSLYLLFKHSQYYPGGGLSDLVATIDSVSATSAETALRELELRPNDFAELWQIEDGFWYLVEARTGDE